MGRPQRIDRDALHRILWRRCRVAEGARTGQIEFVGQEYAASLLISPYHFSRIMAEGERMGRWTVIKKMKHSVNVYQVVDPAVWVAERNGSM